MAPCNVILIKVMPLQIVIPALFLSGHMVCNYLKNLIPDKNIRG